MAQHVFFGVAGDVGEGGVDRHQHAVAVEHHHAVARAFQGSGVQADAFFGQFAQGFAVQVGERKAEVAGHVFEQGALILVLGVQLLVQQEQMPDQLHVAAQRDDGTALQAQAQGLVGPGWPVGHLRQIGGVEDAAFVHGPVHRRVGVQAGQEAVEGLHDRVHRRAAWQDLAAHDVAVPLAQGHPGLLDATVFQRGAAHMGQQIGFRGGPDDGLVDLAEEVVQPGHVHQALLGAAARGHVPDHPDDAVGIAHGRAAAVEMALATHDADGVAQGLGLARFQGLGQGAHEQRGVGG